MSDDEAEWLKQFTAALNGEYNTLPMQVPRRIRDAMAHALLVGDRADALHPLMWCAITIPQPTPDEQRRAARCDFWMLYGEAILCSATFVVIFAIVFIVAYAFGAHPPIRPVP